MNGKLVAVLAVALVGAGCASVTRGTSEKVTVNMRPTGAAVRTSLGASCPRSPCTFEVKRNKAFDAFATKPGYREGQVHVATKLSKDGTKKLVGNFIFPGGTAGAVIDTVTGAARDHTPNPALIVLQPAKGGKAKAAVRGAKKPKRRGVPTS